MGAGGGGRGGEGGRTRTERPGQHGPQERPFLRKKEVAAESGLIHSALLSSVGHVFLY